LNDRSSHYAGLDFVCSQLSAVQALCWRCERHIERGSTMTKS
jgi:hypothetical protein